MRVLLVKSRGRSRTDNRERALRQRAGEEPRSLLLEEVLGCDVLDEFEIADMAGWRGKIYKVLPFFVSQAIEAALRSGSYDVVVTWSERHTVAVAALFACFRVRTPHLALMFWMSKPAVRVPLRVFRSGLDRIITWSSVQRLMAIEGIGFSPEDIVLVRHPVDQEFFRPTDKEQTIIFSAGSTERDFGTLAEAAQGLNIPVRIAASLVVTHDGLRTATKDVREQLSDVQDLEVGPLSPLELRDSYAAAKVVVVPLLPSDIDAGVNVILEGMAMGRPVIASRTRGQIDVIRHGENGILVPPGDASALRASIEYVVREPQAAAAMGRRARAYVEECHRLEDFVEQVRANAEVLSAMKPRRLLLGRS
jgi:glycosyltransferase involved in cell wall biosynthesis